MLPSQISNLADLQALVRLKNYDFVISKWDWEPAKQIHEPFILRKDLLLENNMAEVAFTVAKDFQGMGLGKLFLKKLASAAREHGIAGLVAYTAPHNQAMIRLFKTLPYKIKTSFDGEALSLSCRFDELRDELA